MLPLKLERKKKEGRKRKNLAISHTQHRAPPIQILISTIETEREQKKKRIPHSKQKTKQEKLGIG